MNDLIEYKERIIGNYIAFDKAVKDIKILDTITEWAIGEYADKLELKYGDKTLAKFAEAIGRNLNTVKGYTATYRSWKTEKVRPRTISTAKEMNILPSEKKQEILMRQPSITRDEARQEVKEYKNDLFANKPEINQIDAIKTINIEEYKNENKIKLLERKTIDLF